MNRLFSSASVALSATTCPFARQATQPSLVLFMTDDCSYYDLGCYGSVDSKISDIDNFAIQGVRFAQAYQAAPMSSLTCHNLHTSSWPVGSGAYSNHTCADQGTLGVVYRLHPLGYKVALTGKKHAVPEPVFPFDLCVPNEKRELHFEAIRKFIADCKRKGQPSCLFVASSQSHTPQNRSDVSQLDPDKLTLAPMYVDVLQTRQEFIKHLAEVNFMDQELGDVLSILEQEKVADQFAVAYLSEQGNSLPFAKQTCYDAGVHSACIVRWPGVVKPRSASDVSVEHVDIVPTFVDIAGGKSQTRVDGESFKSVLTGKKKECKKYSFSPQTSRGVNKGPEHYGIRLAYDGKYRYIVNLTPEAIFQNAITATPLFKEWKQLAETGAHAKMMTFEYQHRPAIELYDVRNDPFCMNNLVGDMKYPNIIIRLDAELKKWMKACGDEGQTIEVRAFDYMPSKQK